MPGFYMKNGLEIKIKSVFVILWLNQFGRLTGKIRYRRKQKRTANIFRIFIF